MSHQKIIKLDIETLEILADLGSRLTGWIRQASKTKESSFEEEGLTFFVQNRHTNGNNGR